MRAMLQNLSVQASLVAFPVIGEASAAENLLGDHESIPPETAHEASVTAVELDKIPDDLAHDVAGHVDTASHGAAEAGLPQLDPEWFASQIFWLLATFAFLYTVFARNILPSLSKIIEKRHEHIQSDLDKAHELKEEAEKVQAAYEEAVAEAHEKASGLFAKAEENIKKKSAKKQEEFRDKSIKDLQAAEKKIQKAKDKAMEEMHTIAAEIASQAAEKIVGISTDVKAAKTVIDNISSKKAA